MPDRAPEQERVDSPPLSRVLRKRLPFVVIIAALLIIGPRLFKREVELNFSFPAQAQRLRIEVSQAGAIHRGIDIQLSAGETSHREELELMAGAYRIEARVSLPDGPRVAKKSVELPEDSPVEIRF